MALTAFPYRDDGYQRQTGANIKDRPIFPLQMAQKAESTMFDGCQSSFSVEGCDENAPGFLKWGWLEYIGEHYLKFHDGPYWLKGGNDTPEDLLAYKGL